METFDDRELQWKGVGVARQKVLQSQHAAVVHTVRRHGRTTYPREAGRSPGGGILRASVRYRTDSYIYTQDK